MNDTPNKSGQLVPFIIVVLLIALIWYALTFGKSDFVMGEAIDSFEEKRRAAAQRHAKLLSLLKMKKEVKRKLDKRFKWAYHGLTFLGVIIFFGINAGVYIYYNLDLGTVLNANTAVWVSFGVVNVVYFGSRYTLRGVLRYFKTAIENKVYSKYINIDDQIENHTREISELETVISSKLPSSTNRSLGSSDASLN